MRRAMLVLVAVLATGLLPGSAAARPGLPGILGVITKPVGAILGAARLAGRRVTHHPRHGSASAARRAAPAAAAAAAATGAAAASSASAPAAVNPSDIAPPATTATAATPDATPSQTKPSEGEAASTKAAQAPKPVAATQRNAAVTSWPEAIKSSLANDATGGPDLGMVGPAVWPTAFTDIIGYALWPKDYAERLRAHGIGDVLATAFTPGAALYAHAEKITKKMAKTTVGSGGSGMCSNAAATNDDWPVGTIERSLNLDDAQRSALGELKSAVNGAAATIRASCRDEATPVDRLRAMQNTLWAVHDAAQTIRAPLAKFYDSLSDEQRKQFAAPDTQAGGRSPSRSEIVRMCGPPTAHELPVQRVEQSLHPSKAQRASLDSLQKKSFEMGQFLMASCLKPLPATPAERLDAAADRLTAVIFAASNVNIALNDFTTLLDSAQKAKLSSVER